MALKTTFSVKKKRLPPKFKVHQMECLGTRNIHPCEFLDDLVKNCIFKAKKIYISPNFA